MREEFDGRGSGWKAVDDSEGLSGVVESDGQVRGIAGRDWGGSGRTGGGVCQINFSLICQTPLDVPVAREKSDLCL